jgi:hypothetical protein
MKRLAAQWGAGREVGLGIGDGVVWPGTQKIGLSKSVNAGQKLNSCSQQKPFSIRSKYDFCFQTIDGEAFQLLCCRGCPALV